MCGGDLFLIPHVKTIKRKKIMWNRMKICKKINTSWHKTCLVIHLDLAYLATIKIIVVLFLICISGSTYQMFRNRAEFF